MTSCAKCETPLEGGTERCPKCGSSNIMAATLSIGANPDRASSSSTSTGSGWRSQAEKLDYANPLSTRTKPKTVNVIEVLAALGGIDAILIASGMNFLTKVAPSLALENSLGLSSGMVPLFFMSILAILSLVSAYAFYKGSRRGWGLGILFSVVGILSILWSNYVGFVFGLVTLYCLTRFETKVWFHKV
jgi:hypothetical protein